MRILRSPWLVVVLGIVGLVLFYFRPGGVAGPRPAPQPTGGRGFTHEALTRVLQAVVAADGTVDYALLRADRGPLDLYLGQLRATSPASAPHRFKADEERLAYYINAFNAFVLAGVREHCPLDSVRDAYLAEGFFWRVSYLIGEEEVTLQKLEADLIRQVFRADPDVFFGLSRGANGCPPLQRQAFEGATLREQLKQGSEAAFKDTRCFRKENGFLWVSELLEWKKADFRGGFVSYVNKKVPGFVDADSEVKITAFDWNLNGDCGP